MHISDGVLNPVTLATGWVAAGGLTALGSWRVRDRDYPRMGLMTAAFFVAGLIHLKVPPTSVHLSLHALCGAVLGLRAFPVILVGLGLQAALLGHGGFAVLGVNACIFGIPACAAGLGLRRAVRRGRGGRLALAAVLAAALTGGAVIGADVLGKGAWVRTGWFWLAAVPAVGVPAVLAAAAGGRGVGARSFRLGAAAGGVAVMGSAALLSLVLGLCPLAPGVGRPALRTLAEYAFLAHAPVVLVELAATGLVVRYLARAFPEVLGEPGGAQSVPEVAGGFSCA
jgi:cobalt/nickel transport system permease protein